MSTRSTWFRLFAAGTALVVLTSAATAIAMNMFAQSHARQATNAEQAGTLSGNQSLSGFTASRGETAKPDESMRVTIETSQGSTGLNVNSQTAFSDPASTQPGESTTTAPPVSAGTASGDTSAAAKSTTRATTQVTATTTADAIGSASLKTSTSTGTASTAKFITASQAGAAAAQRIGTTGLRVVAATLEASDYPPKYEVKLMDSQYKYEVEVHAVTGLVIETEREPL